MCQVERALCIHGQAGIGICRTQQLSLTKTRQLPRTTRIVVDDGTQTIYVQMTANVSPLFPEFLQTRPISAWGEAQVRVSGR